MRRGWLICLLPALLAAGPPAPNPVRDLAGRYSAHFENGLVDGSSYWSDDVAEIVPVDRRHAYLNFSLAFYNGHSCSLSGIAAAEGNALVYRAPADDAIPGEPPCRLLVRRMGDTLGWEDDGTCKMHCGARGSFLNGSLPWRSKRAITYMPRLKASAGYRGAMSEWQR